GSFWLGWDGYQVPAAFGDYVWADGSSTRVMVAVSDGTVPPKVDLEAALSAQSPTDSWNNLAIQATGRNIGGRPLHRWESLEVKVDGQTNIGGTPVPSASCHEDVWNDSSCHLDGELHVTPGTHVIEVCADPDRNSGDPNLSNNCDELTLEVPPLQPDLDVWVDANSPRYGEPWPISVVISNRGNGNSAPYELEVETPGGVESFTLGALGWGHSKTVQTSWIPDVGGAVTVRATVDPDGLIPEHDEENNEDSLTLDVIGAPAETVNLVFEDGSWSVDPASPRSGDPVTFTGRMRNIGSVTTSRAPSFDITVAGQKRVDCPAPLGPGDVCEGSRTFTPNSSGEWLIELTADPQGWIDEGDGEHDNERQVRIEVLEPEPLPQLLFLPGAVAPVGSLPSAGGDLNVEITVRNSGATIPTQPVELQILENGTWARSIWVEAPFYSGSSRQVTHTWGDVAAGTHELRVVVDPADEIDEGPEGEGDNTRSLHFEISDGGNGLTCQGIWELRNVSTGEVFHNLGSVRDGCHVNWGNNVPTSECFRTSGANGLTATWFVGADGCPVEVLVSNGYSLQVIVPTN
ncbi:MAG: CARDB domain-containing protein, partial [Acidobacteriota bacterium]